MPRWIVFALAVVVAGCTKDEGPSPQYTAAIKALETTLSDTLDPTYADPAFDDIEAKFRAVPESASDHDKALGFAEAIAKGRSHQRDVVEKVMQAEAAYVGIATQRREARREQQAGNTASGSAAPSGPVIIYTTAWCGVCKRAKTFMIDNHVRFIERDIQKSKAAARELAQKAKAAGIAVSGVPVFDISGRLERGFAPSSLRASLQRAGYL